MSFSHELPMLKGICFRRDLYFYRFAIQGFWPYMHVIRLQVQCRCSIDHKSTIKKASGSTDHPRDRSSWQIVFVPERGQHSTIMKLVPIYQVMYHYSCERYISRLLHPPFQNISRFNFILRQTSLILIVYRKCTNMNNIEFQFH